MKVYGVMELNDGEWKYHYEEVGRYGIIQHFYKTEKLKEAKKFAEKLTKLNGRQHKIVSREVTITPWIFIDD